MFTLLQKDIMRFQCSLGKLLGSIGFISTNMNREVNKTTVEI